MSLVKYSNCWEDADVLLAALEIQSSDQVLSIASGGDNSFALLSQNPEYILAIDTDNRQLHLTELKKVCFQELEYPEWLSFLGFKNSSGRLDTYRSLREHLSPASRAFFDRNKKWVRKGVIHSGKLEQYFKWFRRLILPLVAGKRKMNELQLPKSDAAQETFYQTQWNGKRWRSLFTFFFGREVMQELGREKAYFKHNKEKVGEIFLRKTSAHLCSAECQTNYFLNYIITGNFHLGLPLYARKEHFQAIKSNLHKLEIRQVGFEDLGEELNRFSALNLSNIFEYMGIEDTQQTSKIGAQHLKSGSRIAYWNMMVDRKIHQLCPKFELVKSEPALVDKGFFYENFFLNLRI